MFNQYSSLLEYVFVFLKAVKSRCTTKAVRFGVLSTLICLMLPFLSVQLIAQPTSCDAEIPNCQSYTSYGLDGVDTYVSNISIPEENACLEIHGNLIIDQNTHFFNSDIKMAEAASIVIESGVRFGLYESKLSAASNKAWHSIKIKKNATHVSIQNNCISDALMGIQAHPELDYMYVFNNYFDRNYYHVFIEDPASTSSIIPVNSKVYQNTFDCSSTLIDRYSNPPNSVDASSYTIAGMKLSYVQMKVGGFSTNKFKNLNNGIEASICNLNVYSAKFEDIEAQGSITPPPNKVGFGIRHSGNNLHHTTLVYDGQASSGNHFDNVVTGIQSTNSNIRVTDCNMNDVVTGIEVIASDERDIYLQDNYLDIEFQGIRLEHNDPATIDVSNNEIDVDDPFDGGAATAISIKEMTDQHSKAEIYDNNIDLLLGEYGISLEGASTYEIYNNEIEFLNLNKIGTAAIGLFRSPHNLLYDNEIYGQTDDQLNKQSGIINEWSEGNIYECQNYSDFLTYSQRFEHINWGTEWTNSKLGDAFTGLFLDQDPIIGTQYHHNNEWDGTYSNLRGHHTGPPGFYPLSKITIPTGATGGDYDPRAVEGVQPGNGLWVVANGAGFPSACSFESPDPGPGPGYDYDFQASDTLIAQGQDSYPNYSDGYNWIAERYLYEKMYLDSTYSSKHSSLSSFLSSTEADTVGTYVDQRYDLKEILNMPDATSNEIKSFKDSYSEYIDSLNTFDSLHQDSLTGTEIQDRQKILDSMEYYMDQISSARENWIETRNSELKNWLKVWKTTYTPDTMHQNEREVVKIYVDNILDEDWSTSDSSDLAQIATQCPLVGGKSVFLARILLETKYDTIYSVGNCQAAPRQKKSRNIHKLTVYPNPTENKLIIEGGAKGAQAIIIDRLGRNVMEFEMNNNKTSVDVSQLKSGIYWIRTNRKVTKFIKQ